MRSIIELLGHLRSLNVGLSLDGDALKCSAPQGVLTPDLRQELGERKPEIIAFLHASQQARVAGDSGIARIDRSGPLPLSLAQQRLWFLNQLDPDSPVYNIGAVLRMKGKIDVAALERTLQHIVQRHEDLRTGFVQMNGNPQAVIRDGRDWRLEKIDVRHLSDDGPGSELLKYAAQLIREKFDITRDSLFRVQLLTVAPEDHILLFVMHHLISDGWSMGVMGQEFAELYSAYAAGREPSLAPLSIQYADFAAWQRKWLESGELDRQLPYWKEQLAGAPPVLGFPADHRRPQREMYRGCRSKLVIPQSLVIALEQLSQRHGVTLFMTLLAAFKVLLARYSGQDDIVVGSPSANRSRAELNQLIGFFVNNLVLRTDLSGNPSFAALLARIRNVTLRAYEHQDVPFDKLVHALSPERSLDHSPLFQVMFILQNYPLDELNLDGIVTTPVELEVDTARFDLTVEVYPRHGDLWAYFDYNSDLYEAETIARIEQHYLAILRAVCADPNQTISSIPLLSSSEQRKLLVEWNRTQEEFPAICFHQRFEAHALATPERLAVIAGGTSLTYGELDERANRIASHLKSRGAGPEKLVALCLERSADLVASILAIAKTGAAYVPLDPTYPAARIANIFEDARPLVVLTTQSLLSALPVKGEEESFGVICLDDLDGPVDFEAIHTAQGAVAVSTPVRPDNLAYVIFTSGSTGRPKGVQITHRALVNFLESMSREPGYSADDVLLAVTTISFDIAGLELLLPLYTGSTVCIALEPGDPESLLADLERYRPTVMQATPATWKLLIAAGWKGDPHLKILCGGEAMDTDLARSLLVRSESLWNMYGPTETTIWSAVLPIEHVGEEAIPVGRPIQNTSFYVLDPSGQPVPQGAPGELWIGGDGLARGYLNRPDLTAERFVVIPFAELPAANPGVRLYRTGDLVRYRSDGTLDFLGRMDHQVKLRGFRIELGEIESALRNCHGVSDAVTLLREDHGEKRLVAYLLWAEGEPPALASVRDHLRAVLPGYMIPSAFVPLQAFPRLPNGKLNRAALPPPERSVETDKLGFEAPVTTLQQTIAEVFRNVLDTAQVGVDNNFFDLGAHSLQIVRAHDELNRRIDPKIPLISFFQYPTIRMLASFIEQQRQAEACEVKQ
ncbi:MAG: amino acid adenylation domain-containing protein [Acidobacteriaceae bacterium]